MGFSRLFRSRWTALFWAGGIVWTAYDVASTTPVDVPPKRPSPALDATGVAVDARDLAILANAGG